MLPEDKADTHPTHNTLERTIQWQLPEITTDPTQGLEQLPSGPGCSRVL